MPTILYIHGLYNDMQLALEARKYFTDKGYNFKEFRLYKKKNISTSVSKVHKRIVKRINTDTIVIGHSLGAVASILSKQINNASKLILWDPSLNPHQVFMNTQLAYNIKIIDHILEDAKNFTKLKTHFNLVTVRTCFITAGKGGYKIGEQYATFVNSSILYKIDKADHNFSDTESQKDLFSKTFDFFT